jgi:hypothetical protein
VKMPQNKTFHQAVSVSKNGPPLEPPSTEKVRPELLPGLDSPYYSAGYLSGWLGCCQFRKQLADTSGNSFLLWYIRRSPPGNAGGVLESREDLAAGETPEYLVRVKMFLSRMQHMPPRHEEGLWSTQIKTIRNL